MYFADVDIPLDFIHAKLLVVFKLSHLGILSSPRGIVRDLEHLQLINQITGLKKL